MTRDRAEYLLPFMTAFVQKKTIQFSYNGQWVDCEFQEHITFSDDGTAFRIKPEPQPPQYRPWKPEEVPVGALVRLKEKEIQWAQWLITARAETGIYLNGSDGNYNGTSTKVLIIDYEHSLDQGKTWLPCGVLVPSQD